MWSIAVLVIGAAVLSEARHTITAWDCFAAKSIERYDTRQLCSTEEMSPEPTQKYQLYQKTHVRRVTGYFCQVRVTHIPAMCGVWGHVKLADVPEILHQFEVSIGWCNELVTRRKFKLDSASASFPLKLE